MSRRAKVLVASLVGVLVLAGLAIFAIQSRDQSPEPSVVPSPQNEQQRLEVEQAYFAYWDAYTLALLNLETTGLENVLSGQALEKTKSLVEEHRASRKPMRVEIRHNFEIELTDKETALITDKFLDRSVPLDAETGHPSGPRVNKQMFSLYTLKRVDAVWKVTNTQLQNEETPTAD